MLREREEQLAHLRAEHGVLRAELAAVKEGLSTSTERAEKLREEGQVSDSKIVFYRLTYFCYQQESIRLQALSWHFMFISPVIMHSVKNK